MENTKPKEILENIINIMEKTNVDEWEIDKLVVVLNYINELENNRDKAIEYIEDENNELIGILENNKDTFVKKQGLLDILRGEDNEFEKSN